MARTAKLILVLSTICVTLIALDTATGATEDSTQSRMMEMAKSSSVDDISPDQYQIWNNFRKYWDLARNVYRAQRGAYAANSRGLANLAFDLANNFFGYQPGHVFTNSPNGLEPIDIDRIFDR